MNNLLSATHGTATLQQISDMAAELFEENLTKEFSSNAFDLKRLLESVIPYKELSDLHLQASLHSGKSVVLTVRLKESHHLYREHFQRQVCEASIKLFDIKSKRVTLPSGKSTLRFHHFETELDLSSTLLDHIRLVYKDMIEKQVRRVSDAAAIVQSHIKRLNLSPEEAFDLEKAFYIIRKETNFSAYGSTPETWPKCFYNIEALDKTICPEENFKIN